MRLSGGKNPKSVWWKGKVKAAVKRKGVAFREVLAASDEEQRKMYGSVQRGEEKG